MIYPYSIDLIQISNVVLSNVITTEQDEKMYKSMLGYLNYLCL